MFGNLAERSLKRKIENGFHRCCSTNLFKVSGTASFLSARMVSYGDRTGSSATGAFCCDYKALLENNGVSACLTQITDLVACSDSCSLSSPDNTAPHQFF